MQCEKLGSGGGVQVERSPMEAEVLGSIPSIGWTFFAAFQSSLWFSASVSATLGHQAFPSLCLSSTRCLANIFFLCFFSACKLCKVNKCSFSIFVLYLPDTALLEPSINMKLLLCGSVEQPKTKSWSLHQKWVQDQFVHLELYEAHCSISIGWHLLLMSKSHLQ